MILTRTPLRISFAGGMSDIPSYYKYNEGAVLSATIDKYVYIVKKEHFTNKYLLKYSQTEDVERITDIQHNILREVMKNYNIKGGVEIGSFADIPVKGTGLGSSSSFTVGLVNALSGSIPKNQIAERACDIELAVSDIGKQDQYAAAFGGINHIQFNSDDRVNVRLVDMDNKKWKELENNLLMFYTGGIRKTNDILKNFKSFDIEYIDELVKLSYSMRHQLITGNLEGFGKSMDRCWELKRKTSKDISNEEIDYMYKKAKEAGALGGKLCGAGGGGFLLLYVPREHHSTVRKTLNKYKELKFKFDIEGTKVLHGN